MRNRFIEDRTLLVKMQTQNKMYNFFNFNVAYFHVSGWPYFEKPKFRNARTKMIWHFYKIVGDVTIFLNTVSVTIVSFLVMNHLGELFASLMAVAYNWGYYVRFFLYQTRKKEIMDVYNSLNHFFNENNEKHEEFFKMYKKYEKMITIFSLTKTAIEVAGCVGLCEILAIQGLYVDKPRLPSYAWYPFPQDVQPNSFLLCQFQNIAFGVLVARVAASDCFFCMVISFLGIQLKVLQSELPHVLRSDPSKPDAQRWEEVRRWIKKHNETLKAIETFKYVISPFLVNTYLTALLLILLCGVVTTSTESWTLSHKVTLILVGVLNLVILFITCKAGDFLIDTQTSVPDEGFTPDLLYSPKKYSFAYKIIQIKCQKLIKLTAYGFHPLSSHTFSVLLRATFSYYLAIIQISQRSRN